MFKILLVEDSEILMDMYKLGLEKAGFEVEGAKNGSWAINLANSKSFDIIIMDMVMPAKNGFEAIKSIKSEIGTQNTPIIILSNSAQDNEVDEAMKMGAAAYLLKSQITPAKLVEQINKIINNQDN